MAYYRVEGECTEYTESYVKADSVHEAIKKAEKEAFIDFDDVQTTKINKKEYEENK